jgi:quercetin dioxygenase-like cupin family protein
MDHTRRELSLLLPLLMAGKGRAQSRLLPSKAYSFEQMPVHPTGPNQQRTVLEGDTHSGFHIELHETELAPGEAPHPPHRHLHEELILIQHGTMEATIGGRISTLGPGSVGYVASNIEHGWRNIGDNRANYFVIALGRDE